MGVATATARGVTAAEVCAMALAAGATFCYRFLTFTQFPNDHFVHVAIGQQMAGGAWPVRDYVERGTPLMSFVSALGQQWIGEGLRAELLIVAGALAVASALCVFVFTRLSGSVAIGTTLALVPTLIYPLSYSYPKLLVYAAALAAVWLYLRRPSGGRIVLVGTALAVAFFFRHDHGVILGIGAAVAILSMHGLTRQGAVAVCRAGGVALLLSAPYLAWVQLHEGLFVHVGDSVEFSRREAERSGFDRPAFGIARGKPLWSRLQEGPIVNVRWDAQLSDEQVRLAEDRHGLTRFDPVGPRTWQYGLTDWSQAAIRSLVTDRAAADTHGIDRTTFALQVPAPQGLRRLLVYVYGPAEGLQLARNALAALYYAVWLLPVAALVAVVAGWRRFPPELRAAVLMAVAVQLAMDATMLRDPMRNRIRDVIVPAAALCAFLAGLAWRRQGPAILRLPARAVAVVLVVALMVSAGSIGEAVSRTSDALEGGLARRARVVNYRLSPPQHRTGGELGPGYQQLVEYVRRCTPQRSRMMTLAFVPELFVYTGREFAAGHAMFTPGYYMDDRNASLMLDRLSREDVPLVILERDTRGEIAATYRRVWDYVSMRYREAGEFEIRQGRTLVVLADTMRPVVGKFERTGMPCFL